MARRTLSPPITHWNTFKQLYLEVFSNALRELAKNDSLSGDEDAISESLCLIIRQVCFNFNRSRDNEEIRAPVPIWEAPIQPVNRGELRGGKKRKRPDFTCNYLNAHAVSPDELEIPLHVECKRLGSPTSNSWNLNKNYVINGIKRFDCSTHQYGKRSPSGMMIGYIISMTPQEIETEVNDYQRKHLPSCPDITFTFDKRTPFQTHQQIQRRSVEPAQFELIHLWVDLRGKYHI
jgi:hypothetical protein